jgi:hypothetical protein
MTTLIESEGIACGALISIQVSLWWLGKNVQSQKEKEGLTSLI